MPPFLIPLIAFIVWAVTLSFYLPVLRLDLYLADQVAAPHFFISFLILVFCWVFSGPLLAAILSALCVVGCFYLALGTREPAFFLQAIIYSGLFLAMVSYLQFVQKNTNDKQILKEKLIEEIHLKKEEIVKSETLAKALEEKIRRFLNLHSFSEEIKGMADLGQAAQKIVSEAYEVLGKADECVLYLVNESRQDLSLVAGVGGGQTPSRENDVNVFDQWVLKRNQAIMVEDSKKDFRFSNDARTPHDQIRSVCVSPLITENNILGVLRASSATPGAFTMDDLRLLDIFAGLGAVTLHNILLYQRMGELAIRDSLTGLYLNRYFQERVNEEIQRANSNKLPFSLILIDIDFFKRYNDEYGHSAGDLVLRNIALIIQNCVDVQGTAARYGGEEFMVLLPDAPKAKGVEMAEKIRREIQKSKFTLRRMEGRVTASMGVAAYPEGGRTRDELIWTADKRLYEAKNSGRNKVCATIG